MHSLIHEALNGVPELTAENLQSIFDVDALQTSFSESPFNQPLMVTSGSLILVDQYSHGEDETLDIGDVLIKLTQDKAALISNWFASSTTKVKEGNSIYLVLQRRKDKVEFKLEVCDVSKVTGLVVPLKDVYILEDSLLVPGIDLDELLVSTMHKHIYDKAVENASPNSLTVLFIGERDGKYSREYNKTANVFDTIRWTNESGDLPYCMNEPKVVHIIRKD